MSSNPRLAAVQVLERLRSTGVIVTLEGDTLPLHSELPVAEAELLQCWLRDQRPGRLLEVGLAYGVSTLSILAALESPPERYDIIDAFQTRDWHGAGLRHLQEAGIPGGLVFHEELSELCLPRLLAAGARYDFAYVDGWHTFDQVAVEFYFINRMLAPGGVIVFDDVHMPSLQKVLAQVLSYPAYERLLLPDDFRRSRVARVRRAAGVPEYRLAAVRKRAEDRRDWDWFEDF